MELYRFILKDAYGVGGDYESNILPKDIQGFRLEKRLAISEIPISYTVDVAIGNIRLIDKYAEIIKRNFFENGLTAIQKFELHRLNKYATDYDRIAYGIIDFATLIVTDSYVEFGMRINSKASDFFKKWDIEVSMKPND